MHDSASAFGCGRRLPYFAQTAWRPSADLASGTRDEVRRAQGSSARMTRRVRQIQHNIYAVLTLINLVSSRLADEEVCDARASSLDRGY